MPKNGSWHLACLAAEYGDVHPRDRQDRSRAPRSGRNGVALGGPSIGCTGMIGHERCQLHHNKGRVTLAMILVAVGCCCWLSLLLATRINAFCGVFPAMLNRVSRGMADAYSLKALLVYFQSFLAWFLNRHNPPTHPVQMVLIAKVTSQSLSTGFLVNKPEYRKSAP